MKIAILYNNEYFDLYASTTITLEVNNHVFSDASGEIEGGYSLPFDLPLSMKNRRLINFVDDLQSTANFISDKKAYLICEGFAFEGNLNVIEVSDKIRIQLIVSALVDFKNVKLSEIEMGTYYLGGDVQSRALFINEVLHNPLDYPYSFFPVYNNGFNGLLNPATPNWYLLFQNAYQLNQHTIHPLAIRTPFVRLSHVLNSIFNEFDFHNNFQVNNELQLLCLYNNYCLVKEQPAITLKNHVSNTLVTDYIKNLQFTFNLGLFKNFSSNKLTIKPMRDVLKSNPEHDWSGKIEIQPKSAPFENGIGSFGFEVSEADSLEHDYEDVAISAWFGARNLITNSNINGISNLYVASTIGKKIIRFESKQKIDDKGKPFKTKVSRLEMIDVDSFIDSDGYLYPYHIYPACFVQGELWNVENKPKCPDKLMFYRGYSKDETGINDFMPYGSNNEYNLYGANKFNYSLNWEGEKGLFETWHKEWYELTKAGRLVTARLNLSAKDIEVFNMYDIVHINGVNYFVKSLKFTLTASGMKPVDATLIRLF